LEDGISNKRERHEAFLTEQDVGRNETYEPEIEGIRCRKRKKKRTLGAPQSETKGTERMKRNIFNLPISLSVSFSYGNSTTYNFLVCEIYFPLAQYTTTRHFDIFASHRMIFF